MLEAVELSEGDGDAEMMKMLQSRPFSFRAFFLALRFSYISQ